MNGPMSRRKLLTMMATLAGAVGLVGVQRLLVIAGPKEPPAETTPQAYIPLVTGSQPTATPTATPSPTPTATRTPGATGGKVIHLHAASATSWDFSTGWYGDYVNQEVVNKMVDRGLRELTGRSTVADAWSVLLPGYSAGKGIAVKVNFNNAGCSDSGNMIDALAEPVNSLIRGMKLIGVREQDIWIYDAIRPIPTRFHNHCAYSGVHFIGIACAEQATFNSTDPNARVIFANPNLQARRLADALINATYLINVPILKDHGLAGKTLGFKNHFGTIEYVEGSGADKLHNFLPEYSSTYSALVDIYLNPHIRNKTVLTVGDGLYGSLVNTNRTPERWQTFSNDAPNSLFLATDPVAIDCVMMDILSAEPVYHPLSNAEGNYLKLASAAGLGVFERGQPWGAGYSSINYARIEL
jgi:hypothetical protein